MQWVALYNDGTGLCQYNADGSENRYSDIDRTRLRNFALFSDERKKIVDFHLLPEQVLIYRRRVEKRSDGSEMVVYMVGWMQKIGEHTVQAIAFVFPGGEMEILSAFYEGRRWFDPPEFIPCEMEAAHEPVA